jgi:DNA-directed RNA polymerase subunit L
MATDPAATAGPAKVRWLVRTASEVVAHVHDEDFTTMNLLHDALVRTPGVLFASCAVPQREHHAVLSVRMEPGSRATAEQAVQAALQAVLRKCARFRDLARETVPSFHS